MEKINQNKALWIFPNIKESVDMLPQKLRGQAWEMIINYSFGDENVEQNCKNLKVLLAFRVVKPLLRLRGIAGSQNGKSNNPSGLAKNNEPNITPNIGANITPNSLNNNNRNNLTETENKKQKLKTENITNFESLFTYWEQNKKGGKYKPESRQRMLKKLIDLTNNDFEYAKKAIFYAIDNNYQGFTDGSRLYYKENLPNREVKTQNTKPNTLPVDIDLWNGEYYDFNLSKAVAKAGDNPDWSKYNRKTGTFDL